jgi:hypothetical protein
LHVDLSTETVKGTALALECVNYIERGDSLALSVLCVGDSITNDTLEEGLQNTTSLLVNHCYVLDVLNSQDTDDNLLAEIRLTPPRRARRLIAGFVIPWMLSRRILRWRLAPPFPRPFPPFPPAMTRVRIIQMRFVMRLRRGQVELLKRCCYWCTRVEVINIANSGDATARGNKGNNVARTRARKENTYVQS